MIKKGRADWDITLMREQDIKICEDDVKDLTKGWVSYQIHFSATLPGPISFRKADGTDFTEEEITEIRKEIEEDWNGT